MSAGPVVVLAGGTGGAKLARGMRDVVAGDELTVLANTGDDLEVYGGYVAPDPDLVTYWLADRIDPRGWGLRDDTFAVMDGLRELGADVYFELGDRDLAVAIERARLLRAGGRLTDAQARIVRAFGAGARVLPMSDAPVRTRVRTHGRDRGLQEFLIRDRGAGPIDDVRYDGAAQAPPTPEVLDALAAARAIVIGPSNPVLSIGPVLALPGMREALAAAAAPIVAVSPLVGGRALKGPTEACLAWAGYPRDAAGIAAAYAGVADGLIADEPTDALPCLRADVLMDGAAGRRRLAHEALAFAARLAPVA